MATWDFMGYAVFRPGYLDDYDTGTAVFTSEERINVPIYEVPDAYITNPEDVDIDEITAAWPSLAPVDIDQEIISIVSDDDTGAAGHRIYLWGDGTGRGNAKGETAYETSRMLFMPATFVIGCGAGGAGYMPFVYHNGHGEVWLLGPIDQGAIPKNVYIVGSPDEPEEPEEPENPETSHVVESKGDGYALYNGFKFPNIDSVWDNETYPYAFIEALVGSDGSVIGYVAVFTNKSAFFSNGSYLISGTAFHCFMFIEGAWHEFYPGIKENGGNFTDDSIIIWSNHNVLNISDNSTYLSASDPIPLDGMNVIEWDGDTTGLDNILQYYWLVSDTISVSDGSEAVAVVSSDGMRFTFPTSFVYGEGDLGSAGYSLSYEGVILGLVNTGSLFENGLYLCSPMPYQDSSTLTEDGFPSLIAYRSTAEETESNITITSGDGLYAFGPYVWPAPPGVTESAPVGSGAVVHSFQRNEDEAPVYFIGEYFLTFSSDIANSLVAAGVTTAVSNAWFTFEDEAQATAFEAWLGDSPIVGVAVSTNDMGNGTPYGPFTLLDGWKIIEWDGDYTGGTAPTEDFAIGAVPVTDYFVDADAAYSYITPYDHSSITYTGDYDKLADNYWLVSAPYGDSNSFSVVSNVNGLMMSGNDQWYTALAFYRPTEPETETETYDKTAFLSGMAMGLTGKGDPTKLTGSDVFSKGYKTGAELRRKRDDGITNAILTDDMLYIKNVNAVLNENTLEVT